jgi:PAS domain S-box-containing protein
MPLLTKVTTESYKEFMTIQQINLRQLPHLRFSNEEKEEFYKVPNSYYTITNGSDYFLKFSPNLCDLLGYTYEELSRASYFNLIHPDDLKSTMAMTLSLAARRDAQDTMSQFTNRFLTKDNKVVWLQWSAKVSTNGHIYSVAHEVTSLMSKTHPEQGLKTRDQLIEDFTETELQIFSFLVQRVGSCVTKQELYLHLYGDIKVQDQTINVHISNLRKKIKGSTYTLKTAGKGRWKMLNKFESF